MPVYPTYAESQTRPAPVESGVRDKPPPGTSLNIGTDDTTDKIRKRRMQEEYRLQLEAQFSASNKGVRPARRTMTNSLSSPDTLAEEKRVEALRKRQQQDTFRAALDNQVAASSRARQDDDGPGRRHTQGRRLADKEPQAERLYEYQPRAGYAEERRGGSGYEDRDLDRDGGMAAGGNYGEDDKKAVALAKRRQQDAYRAGLDDQIAASDSRQRGSLGDVVHGRQSQGQAGVKGVERAYEYEHFDASNPSRAYPDDLYSKEVYDGRARANVTEGSNLRGQYESEEPPYRQDRRVYRSQDAEDMPDRSRVRFNAQAEYRTDKGTSLTPNSKSPNAARQRMLMDVYGFKMQESSVGVGDEWKPSKGGADDKEKKRLAVEQQKEVLKQQIEENKRFKESERAKERMEEDRLERKLRLDMAANKPEGYRLTEDYERDQIMGGSNATAKGSPPDALETADVIEKSVREALERKFGKHGAMLRLQKEGKVVGRQDADDKSFYRADNPQGYDTSGDIPIRPTGKMNDAGYENDSLYAPSRSKLNRAGEKVIDPRSSLLEEDSSFHYGQKKSPAKPAPRASSQFRDEYESGESNYYADRSKPSRDVSFISESKMLNADPQRKQSFVEQSLNCESIMMYSSDPSVIFGKKARSPGREKDNSVSAYVTPRQAFH